MRLVAVLGRCWMTLMPSYYCNLSTGKGQGEADELIIFHLLFFVLPL
jgi:hypothetical protein